jgi:DNA-binding NtrC family response regulator
MAALEREHLVRTLRHTGCNISAAARLLGWDRNQLRRKMQKHGIEMPGP